MDAERALIDKMSAVGGIERLLVRGVVSEHFLDPENERVYGFCVKHVRKYKTPPSYDLVKRTFSSREWKNVADALDFVLDEFIKGVKRREGINALRDLAKAVDDPQQVGDIDALFLEQSRRLATLVPSSRTGRLSEAELRIAEYERLKSAGLQPGIPLGIPTFDREILGVRPNEFVSIAGWQGKGKSTLLQHIFFNAYMQGKSPMIVSLEMGSDELYDRFDTMGARLDSHAKQALELDSSQMDRWKKWAERAKTAKEEIIVLDDVGRCTPDKVYAETARYRPDMVGVDYVSLMDAPGTKSMATWERVTYLTRQLKMNARTLGIPVFAVAQTNLGSANDGASLETIAYSRSIGQDSDIVLGLHQDDEMREQKRMTVRMLKNRRGPIRNVDMLWDPGTMTFEEWDRSKHLFTRKDKTGMRG